MNSVKYVALLRGINVGKAKQVKMELLRKALEGMGVWQVKTLLNSGNVVFETEKTPSAVLQNRIEETLEKTFGFQIPVLIRTSAELESLVKSDPFKGIPVTSETRLYVTFFQTLLIDTSVKPLSEVKALLQSPKDDFRILRITTSEICSVLILSQSSKTTEAMSVIEKEFGKKVTTRNWNTICKLVAL